MAEKEKLERLRAKRGGNRGAFTKKLKDEKTLLDGIKENQDIDDIQKGQLKVLRQFLEQKKKVLHEYDEQILDLCPVQEIDKEIEEADDIHAKINDVLNIITDKLSVSVTQNASATSHSNANTAPGLQHSESTTVAPKLPKLILQKFKGEITEFQSFWDAFNSTIDQNSGIPNTDKFKHLKALLEGPPARLLQGLLLTDANYAQARALLEEQYIKPQVIISAHMDNILKLNPCSNDKPHQMRYIFDQIRVQIRGLESLGVKTESYGQLLIPIIVSKLPLDMRLQVSRQSSKKVWEIDELLALIQKEIEARETTELVKLTQTDRNSKDAANSYQGRQRSQGPATASTLYMRSNEVDQKVVIVCVYCKQQHFSASCETVKDINQRKNILLRDRRCFTCLKTGHLSKNCRSTRKCRKCSGNHHQSICHKDYQDVKQGAGDTPTV